MPAYTVVSNGVQWICCPDFSAEFIPPLWGQNRGESLLSLHRKWSASLNPVLLKSGFTAISMSARFKSRDKALMRLLLLYYKVIKSLKKRISKKKCARWFVSKRIMCVWLKVSVRFSASMSPLGLHDRRLLYFHLIVCIYCAYHSLAH